MKTNNSIALLLLASTGLISSIPVNAYEISTHARITYIAYTKSALGQDLGLIKDLGIDFTLSNSDNPFGLSYYDSSATNIETRQKASFEESFMDDKKNPNGVIPDNVTDTSLPGWLMRGAIREDDAKGEKNPQDDTLNPNLRRPLHHFFDPYYNRPLHVLGFALPDNDVHRAPGWAVGSRDVFNDPDTAETGRRNHFTVFDAREAMYRTLTLRRLPLI